VLIVLLFALGLFYLLLRPPFSDLRAMAVFLAITATLSLVAGYAAYRGGWLARLPGLSWTLLGIYALSSILTFLNVWVTARLMFASLHDLRLATVLLIFAGGIAMMLGYFLSAGLTDRIRDLASPRGRWPRVGSMCACPRPAATSWRTLAARSTTWPPNWPQPAASSASWTACAAT
jgi:hypothetical protein